MKVKFAKQSTGRQFGDMRTVHGKVQYVTVLHEKWQLSKAKARFARDPWMEYCKYDLLLLMHSAHQRKVQDADLCA